MKEFRVLDHNDPERYNRFEIQQRSRFLGVWGWWVHVTAFKTEDQALEHINKLETLYDKRTPTELYRVRVK